MIRVLGIDPGFERVGFAVIERDFNQKDKLLFSECFKTCAKLPFHKRLVLIGAEVVRVINKYKTTDISIETLIFSTNQKTAMHVSEARGVVLYEACKLGLTVGEYSPSAIKVAVSGNGRATKKEVLAMINRLIHIPHTIKYDDEVDAIAAGLTHLAISKHNY
ncbi:MAG: crossover junction endodeoxyribonuclease RuvC [Methanosarcinales archaeon]|nr:crossover junction endodeoxyribonuclease RuvC [Methanosarcinales archaeon]